MKQALTQREMYAKLLPLKDKMTQFKSTDTATLTPEDIVLMQDVYGDVNTLTHGQLPIKLQVGCSSCIREVFHIFISLFDRLAKDPEITQEGKDAEQAERDLALNPDANKATVNDEPFKLTADEEKMLNDIFKNLELDVKDTGEMPTDEDVKLFKGKISDLIANPAQRVQFREFLTQKLVDLDAMHAQAKKEHEADSQLDKVFKDRLAFLVELGAIDKPDELGITAGASFIDYDDLNTEDIADWEETVELVKMGVNVAKSKPLPETENQVPSGNPEPHGIELPTGVKGTPGVDGVRLPVDHVTGVAMNTPETMTPQQKAAATRAKKAVEAAAKHKANS